MGSKPLKKHRVFQAEVIGNDFGLLFVLLVEDEEDIGIF